MAAKKSSTKNASGTQKAASLVMELGLSICAIQELGREFSYDDSGVTASTVKTCISRLTSEMLEQVDEVLVALKSPDLAGFVYAGDHAAERGKLVSHG